MPNAYHYAGRERPVRPGASIGLIGGEAGTATVLVKRTDLKDDSKYLLGCEHVLKPRNIFSTEVVQPAMQDSPGTGKFNRIGNSIKAAGLSEQKTNLVDAAMVRLFPEISAQNFITDGPWPIFAIDTEIEIHQGANVTMIGRSSGVQEGWILEPETEQVIDYQLQGWKKPLSFAAITKCSYESEPGDSGAPVINTETGKLIGLHIARGQDKKGHPCGVFCAIWRVFETLKIELI